MARKRQGPLTLGKLAMRCAALEVRVAQLGDTRIQQLAREVAAVQIAEELDLVNKLRADAVAILERLMGMSERLRAEVNASVGPDG